MKHLSKYLFGLALAAFLLLSCDKITGGGDDIELKTDEKILGNWSVTKYEAFDGGGQLLKTMTDKGEILQSFHRFDFDINCNLTVWVNGKATLGLKYSYTADNSVLFFEGIEYTVATLSGMSLSFNSTFFAPASWTEGQHLKNPISYVRVHCDKAVTQEQ